MPEEDNNILTDNQDQKSLKTAFVIYVDTESLLGKIHACDNNPEKSSKTKISNHTSCYSSLSTHCSFDISRNKHNFFKGVECMKKFCTDVRKHAT